MTPLEQAVLAAGYAPSVLDSQPWSWRIAGDTMQLFAEPEHRVDSIDPDGRLMLLSCGAALHHARTELTAAGWSSQVTRLPDPRRPNLLAQIRLGAAAPPEPQSQWMAAAIPRRRTDCRAFGDRTVPAVELTKLRRFVEAEGAYLHVVRPPGQGASSAVVFGDRAGPAELLRGGAALSALLLLATADGLATAPLSDALEAEWPHRGLPAGIGEPYIVVRLGYPPKQDALPFLPHGAGAPAPQDRPGGQTPAGPASGGTARGWRSSSRAARPSMALRY